MRKTIFIILAMLVPKRSWRYKVRALGYGRLDRMLKIINASVDVCNIPPARGSMRMLQMGNLKLMAAFDLLCREHSIEYFIIGGGVIGKLRHNGFIPWDDDIDLGLMSDQYMKLMKIMREKMPTNDFDILFYGWWNIPKIVHKKTGLFIDIFRFDYMPDNDFKRSEIEARRLKYSEEYNKTFFPKKRLDPKIFPIKISVSDSDVERNRKWEKIMELNKQQEQLYNDIILMGKPASKSGGIMHFSGRSKPCEFHKNEVIFPLQKLDFCGSQMPFPNDMESYAFTVWGNIYEFPIFDDFDKHGRMNFNLDRYFKLKALVETPDDVVYSAMVSK